MKSFKVSDALPADLQRAFDYFKQGGAPAADQFMERNDKALRAIQAHPEICRLRSTGWRLMPIPRSSYAIFYREAPAFWFVGGVVSTVQDPDVIQAQLLLREVRDLPATDG